MSYLFEKYHQTFLDNLKYDTYIITKSDIEDIINYINKNGKNGFNIINNIPMSYFTNFTIDITLEEEKMDNNYYKIQKDTIREYLTNDPFLWNYQMEIFCAVMLKKIYIEDINQQTKKNSLFSAKNNYHFCDIIFLL
jgi:hypothetical protein